MGLDILAYSELKKLDCVFNADGEPIDPVTREDIEYPYFQAYINEHFTDHAKGLEDGACYGFKNKLHLHAGSYGGYNNWRENLAKIAGYPAAPQEYNSRVHMRHDEGAFVAGQGPFFELIYFSDCEGVINSEISAKLAKDFADFQEKSDSEGDEYWREKYSRWREVFELASNNGAVNFS